MNASIQNFYKCVANHPQFVSEGKIFVGYTECYNELVNHISCKFAEINPQLRLVNCALTADNLLQIKNELSQCDLFILFYNSDYSQKLGRPIIIQKILPELKQYWQKSCVLKDYGDYFKEAFGVCPEQQQALNNELISLAADARKFIYQDELGSKLEVNINGAKWTSVCGCGNRDLVPGEIATIGTVNGIVKFSGTFLSVIPFASKYGIIRDPLTLTICNNIIVEVESNNSRLVADFQKYIRYNASNARVEEVGIGTNHAISLHGINAGFEERHVGLHLGLGGAMSGSDHLDLIFQSGSLFFDNKQIIENELITFKA